jgi:glucosamine-6-phosphate deaminase
VRTKEAYPVKIFIYDSYEEMSKAAASIVRDTLNLKPNAVLGLATGSTPLGLYREMIRMNREEGMDFSRVTSFNLDEYLGLPSDHAQSYHYFMNENLFKHINILPQNTYVPSGTPANYKAFCDWYENQIVDCGGIDLQVLGIGSDGHIGFNEPSSSLGSRTRIKTLSKQTINDNARFFDKPEDVPKYAITMGVGTILEAKQIILLANGKNKASVVAAAIEGPVCSMITASALQHHENVSYFLDREAASELKLLDYYIWIQEKAPEAPSGF